VLLALLGVIGSDISLFVFSIKRTNVNHPKYFYVLAVKKAPFHSNSSPYNTPSLPQPNTSYRQNYTPVSAKFRNTSTVSLQTADTTTVKTTHLRKLCAKHSLILFVVKTVNVPVEGHELFGSLQSLYVFFLRPFFLLATCSVAIS
jgi:uncharacterized membrane protein